jgi:hypothetical protein
MLQIQALFADVFQSFLGPGCQSSQFISLTVRSLHSSHPLNTSSVLL